MAITLYHEFACIILPLPALKATWNGICNAFNFFTVTNLQLKQKLELDSDYINRSWQQTACWVCLAIEMYVCTCVNLRWQTAQPGQKVCACTHDTRWGISSSPWCRFDSICVHTLQCWCTDIHSPPHGCSCRCPLGSSYKTRSHLPGGPQGLVTHNTRVSKIPISSSKTHNW